MKKVVIVSTRRTVLERIAQLVKQARDNAEDPEILKCERRDILEACKRSDTAIILSKRAADWKGHRAAWLAHSRAGIAHREVYLQFDCEDPETRDTFQRHWKLVENHDRMMARHYRLGGGEKRKWDETFPVP